MKKDFAIARVVIGFFLLVAVCSGIYISANWQKWETPNSIKRIKRLVQANGEIDDPQDEFNFRGINSLGWKVRGSNLVIKFGNQNLVWNKKEFTESKTAYQSLLSIGIEARYNKKKDTFKISYLGEEVKELYK